jgi:RNA recognition motif-containing protein
MLARLAALARGPWRPLTAHSIFRPPCRPARPESRKAIQTKLFVGNLSFDTTPEQVRAVFAEIGEVLSVNVPVDRDTGRPRGFAFVEFATAEQAEAAIGRLDGYELDGRALRVNEATERGAGGPPSRGRSFAPAPPTFRARPKGSRRNLRARKRGF